MNNADYPAGYGRVHPVADYRPWDVDPLFSRIYNDIAEHTMVDQYRCYALYQLLQQAMSYGGDILEVGVWRGGTGALLARTARSCPPSAHPPPVVWLADTFSGVVKAGERDPYYKGGEHDNTSVEIVRTLLQGMRIDEYRVLEGVFPEQTATAVGECAFCFCHIDVDTYQSAKDVVRWVWPRLPQGGVVVFDDYGFYGCEGVTALVDEERDAADRIFIHNLNGQAVFVKII